MGLTLGPLCDLGHVGMEEWAVGSRLLCGLASLHKDTGNDRQPVPRSLTSLWLQPKSCRGAGPEKEASAENVDTLLFKATGEHRFYMGTEGPRLPAADCATERLISSLPGTSP